MPWTDGTHRQKRTRCCCYPCLDVVYAASALQSAKQPPTGSHSLPPMATCRHAMNAGRCQVHSCHSLAIVAATHATHDAICHADGHVCHLSCDCPGEVVHAVSHLAALFQSAGHIHNAEDNVWLTRGVVQAAAYAAQLSGASQEQPGSQGCRMAAFRPSDTEGALQVLGRLCKHAHS